MTGKRVLFISNLYPNPKAPNMASFSCQQVAALGGILPVDVIAPVPWTARLGASIPYLRELNGIEVHHPTYLYPPGIFRASYGHCYLASIRSTAEKLLKTRDYGCIYSSWLFPDAWAALKLAKAFGKPLFVKVVGTDVNRLRPDTPLAKKSLCVVEQCRNVIAVSNELKKHLVALGADPKKIEVVYNGVDRTVFHPMNGQSLRREMGIPEGRSVILFVGNLKKEKGLLELATAFASLVRKESDRDLQLVLAGSGPGELQVRRSLESAGVQGRATFLGNLPLKEVAKWMNVCDLICLPSYMEGQPNVLIEALACGARIVATNVGGIPELDRGYGDMRLIEPRSATQLEGALDEMLSAPPGAEPVRNDFLCTWQENAARIHGLFKGAF